MADLCAREQHIRSLEQTARVGEFYQQLVVVLKPFSEPAELNQEPRQHGEPNDDESTDLQLESFVAVTRRHLLSRGLADRV